MTRALPDLEATLAGGTEPVSQRAPWSGTFGAAVAWSVQLVACVAPDGARARFMALGGLLLDWVVVIGVGFNCLVVLTVPLCR